MCVVRLWGHRSNYISGFHANVQLDGLLAVDSLIPDHFLTCIPVMMGAKEIDGMRLRMMSRFNQLLDQSASLHQVREGHLRHALMLSHYYGEYHGKYYLTYAYLTEMRKHGRTT